MKSGNFLANVGLGMMLWLVILHLLHQHWFSAAGVFVTMIVTLWGMALNAEEREELEDELARFNTRAKAARTSQSSTGMREQAEFLIERCE